MHVLLFEAILLTIFIIMLIIVVKHFKLDIYISLMCLVVIIIFSLSIPELLINNYGNYTNECISSYELLKNDYVLMQSGKTTGIIGVVSYIDENDNLKQQKINGSKVIYYDGKPKIEFVRTELGFLYKNKYIIYLNKE